MYLQNSGLDSSTPCRNGSQFDFHSVFFGLALGIFLLLLRRSCDDKIPVSVIFVISLYAHVGIL